MAQGRQAVVSGRSLSTVPPSHFVRRRPQRGDWRSSRPFGRKTCADVHAGDLQISGGLHHGSRRAFKRSRLNQMKPGQTVKAKVENASTELRVWCESCCIRIAPSEERISVGNKTYHKHCYSKLSTKPKN